MKLKLGILIAVSGLILVSCHKFYTAQQQAEEPAPIIPLLMKDDLEGAILLESIDEKTVPMVALKLDSLISRGAKTITIKINSNGGGVEEGLALIQLLEEKIKGGVHVRCVVDFKARSMAFIFLQSAACQERLATKRSMFLAHEPSLGHIEGSRARLRMAAQYLDVLSDSVADIVGSRLKMGIESYKQKIANGDWIFNYNEALAEGAIDGEITPDKIPYSYTLTLPVSDE